MSHLCKEAALEGLMHTSYIRSLSYFLGLSTYLCLQTYTPAVVLAKKSVAIFLITPDEKKEAQELSAKLTWNLLQMAQKSAKAKGLELIDRGLYFSRSNALSAKRWRKRAKRVGDEGLESFSSDPESAGGTLLRASRFYEFAYKYYLDRKGMMNTLTLSGILQFRAGQKKRGIRFVRRGLQVYPTASLPTQLSAVEKKLVKAIRCQMSKDKPATLTVKARKGGGVVYINGNRVGVGETTIKLPPGKYMITMSKDGYRNWGRKLTLRVGQKKTVTASHQRSPRASFYRSLCETLEKKPVGEPLTDQMTSYLRTLRRQSVERLLIGCFAPSKNNKSGVVTWYSVDRDSKKATKAKGRIKGAEAAQKKVLTKMLKSIGLDAQSDLPAVNTFQFPASPGTCDDPMSIQIVKPKKVEPRKRPVPKVKKWNVAVGDWIVVYTKYGFRLQGKVVGVNHPVLTLAVATGRRAPSELKEVKISRKLAKWSWILGPKQEGGFRVGERLIVQTIYRVNVSGTLVSDDGDKIQIKTRQGVESIPWAAIRRLLRRDQ
ncbi:MAG TPA: hypothetical protein DCE42_00820 [Myxococcales bacterium]|nr:hypothetical protein [Myxococcales bacterium]